MNTSVSVHVYQSMNATALQAIPMAPQVVGMLLSGEQTEAYIFAAAAERGHDAAAVNRAIGALVAAGVVRETVIDGRDIVGGFVVRGALVDALALAAVPS